MNTLFLYIKKSINYFSYPFIFVASVLIFINVLHIIPINLFENIYQFFQSNIEFIFGIISVFFVKYFMQQNSKSAIVCAFSYVVFDLTYFSITNNHFGFIFSIIFSFIVSQISSKIDIVYLFYILMLICVVVAIIIGVSFNYLYSGLKIFCAFVSKRPLLFGFLNNVYSVLFGDNFSNLMLYKDYSLSTVINNQLAVGVKNAFAINFDNPPSSVSYYLTGKYLLSIFVTLAYFISLYSKLSSNEAFAFALTSVLAFAFGDIKLFALFLILYNPVIYLSYLAVTFVCYIVPVLMDIRIGYIDNGSVVELIKYGQKWIYFIISGVIISIMSYFLLQIVISKFDIAKNKLLPKDVRKIVSSLGGERNIESINSDSVTVKNPNLINVLKLDCEIHENIITLKYGELELLKEFF